MSIFFNFGYDEDDEVKEEKPVCDHEPDWVWPTLKFMTYHCKICGELYR